MVRERSLAPVDPHAHGLGMDIRSGALLHGLGPEPGSRGPEKNQLLHLLAERQSGTGIRNPAGLCILWGESGPGRRILPGYDPDSWRRFPASGPLFPSQIQSEKPVNFFLPGESPEKFKEFSNQIIRNFNWTAIPAQRGEINMGLWKRNGFPG